uniref:Ankyrin repeat-containing protein n=1 Tax=Borely moumouvirus TaxID=2712067 RepID=A0A6G6ACB4_9VIRU
MENYSIEAEYECCPSIRSRNFTKLMFSIIHEKLLPEGPGLVRKYLKKNKTKFKLNKKNKLGWTALMLASRNSQRISSEKTVKKILKYKPNINLKNNKGNTALSLASKFSNTESTLETVKILLNHGANTYVQNNNGWSPLMIAVVYCNSHSSIDTVKLLLESSANVNLRTFTGWTALHLACRNSNTTSSINAVQLLLDYGADINSKNDNGKNCLLLAVKYCHTDSNVETVKLLLERGCDVNTKINSSTCLMKLLKVKENDKVIEVSKLLLEYGIDINAINNKRYTSLMYAITRDENVELLDLFLKYKCDVNIKNIEGETALSIILKNYDNDEKDTYIINKLLEAGSDINIEDKEGCNALIIAIKNNCRFHVIKLLISSTRNKKYNFYLDHVDNNGNTALIHSLSHPDSINIMNLLLENGANINVCNKNNYTALTLCALHTSKIKSRNQEKLSFLLYHGADYKIKTNKDQTMFDFINSSDIIDYLDIIKKMEITRFKKDQALKNIYTSYTSIIYNPNSLRVKLFSLKWIIENNTYKELLKDNNNIFKYLGVYDGESLVLKLNDVLNFID